MYKKILLIMWLGVLPVITHLSGAEAVTYYVSTTGNDLNSGTTDIQPFKTLAKVKSLSLTSGDQVLFKCGDTWRGEYLEISDSGSSAAPITFSSYPSTSCADKPIFSGAQPVTGWTAHAGNIYKATIVTAINQLFKADQRLPVGRWPNITSAGYAANGGYATLDAHNLANIVADNEIPAGLSTGAMMHIRTQRWALDHRQITGVVGDAAGTMVLESTVQCDIFDAAPSGDGNNCTGWGYYITDHLSTLDEDGEWYYDGANTVYLYSTSGAPDNIEGSVVLNADYNSNDYYGGIILGSTSLTNPAISYVTIDNIELKRWFNHGISGPLAIQNDMYHHLTMRNLTIKDVEAAGIYLQTGYFTDPSTLRDWEGGSYITVSGTTIDGANHYGISAYSSNSTFEYNTFTNIGLVKNLGKYGLGCGVITGGGCGEQGDALRIKYHNSTYSGHDNVIRYNQFDTIGNTGIDVFGANNTISHNVVKNCAYTKGDSGGIRVQNNSPATPATSPVSNVTIQNNIIDNSIGNNDGVKADYKQPFGLGIGVYWAANVNTVGNTIKDTTIQGIYYDEASGQATDNTVYNFGNGTLNTAGLHLLGVNTSVVSRRNIFYGLMHDLDGNQALRAWTLYTSAASGQLTASEDNYFFQPYAQDPTPEHILVVDWNGRKTLAQWKTFSGMDTNSKGNWFTLERGSSTNSVIHYNDSNTAKTVDLGNTLYQDLDQQQVSCSFTLQPFTSKILINTGQTTTQCGGSYLLWTK